MPIHTNLKSAGAAASLVFYERFRGFYSKTIEGKNSTAKATTDFSARAMRMAKQACIAMTQVSKLQTNKEMVRRLSLGFEYWFTNEKIQQNEPLHYMNTLCGFRFNSETCLNQKLETNFEIEWKSTNKISLKIPAITPRQDIIAPARTLSVRLNIISACISINPARSSQFIKSLPLGGKENSATQILIPYTKDTIPAREIEIAVAQQSGCVSLLIASLEYIIMQKGKLSDVTDTKWLPVDILSAVYKK